MPLDLTPAAIADIQDAFVWYQRQGEGLGYEFLGVVRSTARRIEENPAMYAVVHGDTRRALLHGFPYGLFH